jgi:DNA-binding CsgD family transcriptional regulator
VQATWPLVGREEELGAIASALAVGRSVMVAGEPGVGKTRLIAESASRAAERYNTETIRGHAGMETVPLGALLRMLGPAPAPTEPTARMAAVVSMLLERAADRPLLLVVDDVHDLDEASAAVVRQVVESDRVVALMARRRSERVPDSVTALWKDGDADRLELQALSTREVGLLASVILDGPVDPGTTSALWRLSRGVPLYVRELLAAAREGGALSLADGRWRMDHAPVERSRLQDLIGDRIRAMDDQERDALELVAVAGEVDLDGLLALVDERVLARLEEQGLVQVEREVRGLVARCGHPLDGEVIRSITPAARTREHVRSLAAQVSNPPSGDDVVRLANWQEQGHLAADAEILIAAAVWVRALDDPQAERLARAACEAGGGDVAKKLLADILIERGSGDEALALFDELDQSLTDPAARLAVGLGRVSETAWLRYRLDEALALLDALEPTTHDPRDIGELRAVRSGILLFVGRVAEARTFAESVRAESSLPDETRALACLAALPCAAHLGDRDAAFGALAEAEQLLAALLLKSPREAVQLQLSLLMSRLLLSDLDPAAASSDALYMLGEAVGSDQVRGAGALGRGYVALGRGEIASAVDSLEEAVAAASTPHFGFLPWSLDMLAIALARAGRPDEAEVVLTRAGTHPERFASFEAEHLRAQAEVSRSIAATGRARTLAEQAVERAASSGLGVFEIGALHTLADVGGAPRAADRFDELAANGHTDLRLESYGRHARALAEKDARGLLEVAGDLAELGFRLDAVDAARAAAQLFAAEGRRVSALDAERQADIWLEACPGAVLPTVTLPGPGQLTARENEVALLAARGLSDADIADRLDIAVRTVTTHLHRVYTKLGIGGREDLGAGLGTTDT